MVIDPPLSALFMVMEGSVRKDLSASLSSIVMLCRVLRLWGKVSFNPSSSSINFVKAG